MTGLDDREKAQEASFAHDGALTFRINARRNRLAGLWAAEKLGLSGAAAEAFAAKLVEGWVESHTADDLVARLAAEFAAKKIELSDHRIRNKVEELAQAAAHQIRTE